MALSDEETMTVLHSPSMMDDDDQYEDMDDGYRHDHQDHNLSRLSMCRSNSTYDQEEEDGNIRMFMSGLSIKSFDADVDADEEYFSDGKERNAEIIGGLSSDSYDKQSVGGWYSLPATPPSQRRRRHPSTYQHRVGAKEYASENEAHQKLKGKSTSRRRRKRRLTRDRRDCDRNKNDVEAPDVGGWNNYNCSQSFSGDSESGGGGMMVITRPKGGQRSLCMDMEEVKACSDLGFELEHERLLEMMPRHLSISASTLDTATATATTSSGGNSPIANWRISSPGDDPRDVKARLKVWAQAVALASTSRPGS